jgi:multidrug transporter EmrE-like cation transporter
MNLQFSAWFYVFIAGINTCIGNLLLKQSRRVAQADSGIFSMIFSPWFIMGALFFGINVILFTKALEKLPVSAAYPVLAGLGFCLLAIFSNLIFNERLSLSQWFGVAFILTGIIIVSRQ